MTSLVSAAPGGASMPGTEIAGPPGCANGTGGRSNRSRSRPGWSLGGTICAPGGTTCATAANETLAIAKAAAMARALASMPPDPSTNGPQNFTSGEESEAIAGARRQPPAFGNFCRCFNKVTPAEGSSAFASPRGDEKPCVTKLIGVDLLPNPSSAQPHREVERAAALFGFVESK